MSNQFTYHVLKDTTQMTEIKLTGAFDGTSGQESNAVRIQANTLYGALDANNVPLHSALSVSNTALSYYGLSVTRIDYSVNMGSTGYVNLYWNGSSPMPIVILNRNGSLGENQGQMSLPNNARGATGDIGISTVGAQANSSYTLILELRKNNAMYQRGQFNDPAAFNYPPYGIEP